MKQLYLLTISFLLLSVVKSQTILWEKTDHGTSNYLNPEGTAIIPNDSGTYWLLENAEQDDGSYFGISKDLQGKIFNINGNEVWNSLYNTGIFGINHLGDYCILQNNKLLISGFEQIPYKDVGNEQCGIVCIDHVGNLIWDYHQTMIYDSITDIFTDLNENIYLLKQDYIYNDTIIKFSNNGSVIWRRGLPYNSAFQDFSFNDFTNQFLLFSNVASGIEILYLDTLCQPIDTVIFDGNANDNVSKALMLDDGNYILIGYSNSTTNYFTGNHGSYDGWIAKCDSSGNVLWSRCYGGSDDDKLYFISKTNDGGFLISGTTNSNDDDLTIIAPLSSGNDRGWLMKIDSLGNILWQYIKSDRIFSAYQTTDSCYVLSAGTKPNAYFSKISFFGYNIIQLDSIGCHSPDSANIFGTAYGGFPPYSYQWSTGDTTANLTNVPQGIYYVTVTDSLGNTNTNTDTISVYLSFSTPMLCINTDTSNNYRNILISNYSNETDSIKLIAQNNIDTINLGTFASNSVLIDSTYIDSLYDYYIIAFNSCSQQATSQTKTPLFLQIDSTNNNKVYLTCTAKLGILQFPPYFILCRINPDGTSNYFNNALNCLQSGINNTCSIVDNTLTMSGEYKYFFKVSGISACFSPDYFSNVATVDVLTEVKTKKFDSLISIYPVPTDENLSIVTNDNSIIEKVEIINISEKILKKYYPQKSKLQLSVKELQNGLYFIKIQTGNSLIIKKIIKD